MMDVKILFETANAELEAERLQAMSEEERRLYSMARQLLLLERDLKASAVSRSKDERIARMLDAIAKESF